MKSSKEEGRDALTTALRRMNWLFLALYCLLTAFIFFLELRIVNSFYPLPFRYFYGVIVMPAIIPCWFALLIADLVHHLRWQWLATSLGMGALAIVTYMLIDQLTMVPG